MANVLWLVGVVALLGWLVLRNQVGNLEWQLKKALTRMSDKLQSDSQLAMDAQHVADWSRQIAKKRFWGKVCLRVAVVAVAVNVVAFALAWIRFWGWLG